MLDFDFLVMDSMGIEDALSCSESMCGEMMNGPKPEIGRYISVSDGFTLPSSAKSPSRYIAEVRGPSKKEKKKKINVVDQEKQAKIKEIIRLANEHPN